MAGLTLFLIGCRGCGKSTIGRLLAGRLHVPFLDTDALVVEAIGMSIADCFTRFGEGEFREQESAALERTLARIRSGERLVVATGGGMILRAENVHRMRSHGVLAWLRARPETLRWRLAADPGTAAARPALAGTSAADEVEEVLRAREPLYRQAADAAFDNDDGRPAEEIAAAIGAWLEARRGGRPDPGSEPSRSGEER